MSQLTVRDISARLNLRVEEVVRYLMGGEGKRQGQELRYGSVDGEAGESFGVHLTGHKLGVWSDFSTGETGGDLLDLWCSVRKVSLPEAMKQAKQYLGVSDVAIGVQHREAPKVVPLKRPDNLSKLDNRALAFLREERGISERAAEVYRLTQHRDEIVFPCLTPSGELLNTKFRRFPQDQIRTQAGGAKALFGWQAVPTNARSVVICEGEYKALLWFDYGYPALSVPFGAGKGKQDWIEVEYDRLAQFDTVYLAMDEDEPGDISTDEIIHRLGADRVAVVRLPLPEGGKDIQSCARAGVTAEQVRTAIEKAQPRGPAELKSTGDYRDEVVSIFTDTGPEPGLRTPWGKIGDQLVFRDGELTILAGRTGHGKSQVAGFLLCHALRNNYRACVASFEFKVAMWLRRLIPQLIAIGRPSPGYVGRVMDWMAPKLWAFDAQGTANYLRMIDVFRYCRRRHGATLFIVDNLTGLGISEDDYQGQKEVVQALANFARDEACHVFLVHHVRKAQNQNSNDQLPDQGEIKGAGGIVDLASTVLLVWRNKGKERRVKMLNGAPLDPELLDMPDVLVDCSKQRNYYGTEDGEPRIGLWWHPETFHYLAWREHTPRPFVELDMHEEQPQWLTGSAA